MPKQKTHEVVVKIKFDKPVTKIAAKEAVRNNCGDRDMFATIYEEENGGWNTAKIVAVK